MTDSVLSVSVFDGIPSCRVLSLNLGVSSDDRANVCLVEVNKPPWSINVSCAQVEIVATSCTDLDLGGGKLSAPSLAGFEESDTR